MGKARRERKERQRFRARILGAIVGVVAIGIVAVAAVTLIGRGGKSPKPGPPASPGAEFGALTGSGKDGTVAFSLREIQCGSENVITANGKVSADGVFCLVPVSVQNDGTAPAPVDLTCQFANTADGAHVLVHRKATTLFADSPAPFENGVAAGGSAELVLFFDIAKGDSPKSVELHSPCGSKGVDLQATLAATPASS